MKRRTPLSASILLFIFSWICLESCGTQKHFDIVLLGGTIIDGIGQAAYTGDIGIIGDEIIVIGKLKKSQARKVIDVSGMSIAPGFIDLHAHLDPIFELNNCESHLRQGVTTALGGPDGRGLLPFGEKLDSLEKLGIGMNVGFLCGHNSIRSSVMQLENREPTHAEMDSMVVLVQQAMDEGAFGISTGLKYLPGTFAKIDEIIQLSEVAALNGGIYTSHLRDEGQYLLKGVREAIQIGAKANIPVVLTHHKVIGKPQWGQSAQSLALVDSARQAGLDVMLDQYPYAASYTGIGILIPSWARAGGNGAFIQRIKDPILKDSVKRQIIYNIMNDRGGDDLDRVQFAMVRWDTTLLGKTLVDWCLREGLKPTVENGAELVIRAQVNGGCTCIFHAMDEKDVRNIMQYPHTAIASDGRLTLLGDRFVHPRNYGTFPRVLGKYVREEKVLTLEEAIRKMTSLPADRMGLSDRGRILEGVKADLVIFDPATIAEKGTFIQPHAYPEGIDYVLINGEIAMQNAVISDHLSGQIMRKNTVKREP